MNGYAISLIPRSWAVGVWHKPHKSIYAFGPFRFSIRYGLGDWKPNPPFEPSIRKGVWLSGASPYDRLSNKDRTPAGGALEPVSRSTLFAQEPNYDRKNPSAPLAPPPREGFSGGPCSGELGFDG